MIRYLSVAALLAVGATAVYAQGAGGAAAIKERQAAMKSQAQAMYRVILPMIKGEKPFDQAEAVNSFKAVAESTAKLKTLWPDDSKTGGETRALPKIWETNKDFMEWIDQTVADSNAVQPTVKDLASLKGAFDKVNESCNGCHKDYRQPPKK